jgi:hypothetical protein
MWKSKRRLKKNLANAHERIAELEYGPRGIIAQHILDEERQHALETDPQVAMEDAISKVRRQVYERFLGALVFQRAAERVKTEEERIREKAAYDAEELAQQRVEEFRAGEGAKLLENETSKQWALRSRSLIEAEVEALNIQAVRAVKERARKTAVDKFEAEDKRNDPEFNKMRAADIRERTDETKMIPFSELLAGDKLRIMFAKPGTADMPFTSDYNAGTATRELKLTIQDPAKGMAIVMEDTWFDGYKQRDGLEELSAVQIHNTHHLYGDDDPVIRKEHPLVMTTHLGDHESTEDEVWFVELFGCRVLSPS